MKNIPQNCDGFPFIFDRITAWIQHYIVVIQRVYRRYNVMICENFPGDFFMLDKIEKVWICIEALIRDRICLDIA